jgi:hypothetical protein
MPSQDEFEHDLSWIGDDGLLCLSDLFEITRCAGASVFYVASDCLQVNRDAPSHERPPINLISSMLVFESAIAICSIIVVVRRRLRVAPHGRRRSGISAKSAQL